MEYIDIKGNFDSREDLLVINVNSPAILYGTNELKGISMNVNTENDSLQYDVKLDQYQSGQILVNQASVAGYVNDNKIYFDVAANEQNLDQNIKFQTSKMGYSKSQGYPSKKVYQVFCEC